MFAKVIINISNENVDRPFDYLIPEDLTDKIKVGSQVMVPFGKTNRLIEGFVVAISDKSEYDIRLLKSISAVDENKTSIEGVMIELADFIKTNYGGTMNQALKTVLPVKKKGNARAARIIRLCIEGDELQGVIGRIENDKRSVAKLRLIRELSKEKAIASSIVRDKLHISYSTINALVREGIIEINESDAVSDLVGNRADHGYNIILNTSQQHISDDIWNRYINGELRPSLIRGITGSGKTEIYIDLIDRMVKQGRQAIVLIPEIALTYQTVIRFYRKFPGRVAVINSHMTQAQKYTQLQKAQKGEVDVVIGPRSALFVPFKDLGIIIIDEEHEGTYRNENVPRYHACEVAEMRAKLAGGIVVMGSATPSVESYYKASAGEYKLYELEQRAKGAKLPDVEVIDLREELRRGNRYMTSERLKALIEEKLANGEQIMLFINRRGYANFVSCRQCGQPIKCPHCDVSLKYHNNGTLVCHYCGYITRMVKKCPSCGSKYIGTFGAGTQKLEEEINTLFPNAVTVRMDMDTTREKHSYEDILGRFADHEADILIGTQMIVKGHDFPNVTLVGIMAADLSLYSGGYASGERTYQLITQAAGRAGRSEKKGTVVIQTYSPENYIIRLGAQQDYKEFFKFEMEYRRLLGYPPAVNMMGILMSGLSLEKVCAAADDVSSIIDKYISEHECDITKMGPAAATVSKIKDRYRQLIYVKSADHAKLVHIKDLAEAYNDMSKDKEVAFTFDFSTIGGCD